MLYWPGTPISPTAPLSVISKGATAAGQGSPLARRGGGCGGSQEAPEGLREDVLLSPSIEGLLAGGGTRAASGSTKCWVIPAGEHPLTPHQRSQRPPHLSLPAGPQHRAPSPALLIHTLLLPLLPHMEPPHAGLGLLLKGSVVTSAGRESSESECE